MKANESLNMKGQIFAVLTGADGKVKQTVMKQNMIVDSGFDLICDVIGSDAQPSDVTHIAVGSGTTAAAAGQTALISEITRIAATYDHTAGTKVFTLSATFGAGVGTGAITEAGCLNNSTGGAMLNRLTFDVINKGANDTLAITFTFTLS